MAYVIWDNTETGKTEIHVEGCAHHLRHKKKGQHSVTTEAGLDSIVEIEIGLLVVSGEAGTREEARACIHVAPCTRRRK